MGLLEQKQGQGTFVRSPGSSEKNILGTLVESQEASISDLLEVRRGLECNAAALAASRGVEKDFQFMRKSIEEMQKEVDSGRLGSEADAAFHMAIAYATNNPLQVFIMKNFYDFLFTGIKVNLEGLYKVPGNISTILQQHEAIFEAIRSKDSQAAYQAMKRHIDFVYDFFEGQGE
jgi:GntR family transcriptional repressor for pyruvate dehydrogenase complex